MSDDRTTDPHQPDSAADTPVSPYAPPAAAAPASDAAAPGPDVAAADTAAPSAAPAGAAPAYGAAPDAAGPTVPAAPPTTPPYDVPAGTASASGTPAYGAPGYAAPAHDQAAPAYGAPVYGAPVYGAPVYGAPAHGAPAYGAGSYGYAPPVRTNTLAILSLIASLVGVFVLPFVGQVAGVIMGHISLSQIKERAENGRGMAIAGLIVGYATLALGVILIFGFVILLQAATGGASSRYGA